MNRNPREESQRRPRGSATDWRLVCERSGTMQMFPIGEGCHGRKVLTSFKRLMLWFAPLLMVAAIVAMPAVAQAHNFKLNGRKFGATKEPVLSYGEIELKNKMLHNLKCQYFLGGRVWDETTEGTEKSLEETVGYTDYHCVAEVPCKVANTKGEKVEGIYLTAEEPATAAGKKTGVSSLPWSAELTEKEGFLGVLTHNVKVWLVLPPTGEGLGCLGTEFLFEDKTSSESEKPSINELFPLAVNGVKNGTRPSHVEFRGEEGLEETEGQNGKEVTKPAETGRLESSAGPLYMSGILWITGAKNQGASFELVSAE
jgi:hypothetical protein